MPNINDIKDACKVTEIPCDPCNFIDDNCILLPKEVELDYPPIMFAPLFVDMFITNYKTLTNTITANLTKDRIGFYITHLKLPMTIGSIITTKEKLRTYYLAEYKGRTRDGSFSYKIKSVDDVPVSNLDVTVLEKGVKVFKKGEYK